MAKIIVKKLFGYFDYDLDIGDITKAGIIILSGPNGFGKTVILKCINAIYTSDLSFFFDLNFESFEVDKYETKEKIRIEKLKNGLKINDKEIYDEEFRFFDRRTAYFIREGKVIKEFGTEEQIENGKKLNLILTEMKKIFVDVHFIEDQRLIDIKILTNRQNNKKIVQKTLTVESIQKNLDNHISELNSKYSKLSNELDRTFLKRLFELKEGINKEQFDEKIKQVEVKIKKLNDSGIFKMGTLDVTEFKEDDARALKIYFEDFDKKYQIYEKMIEQIELFKQIVDKHFLFKHLEITDKQKLEVVDDKTEEKIRMNYLSSGEQEIIVLYYTLLFEISEKTIVLIDEPEISLHIAWQRLFAQDIKKIVKLNNIFAIIATHSAQIVSGNRDIQYDLGEIYKNGLNQGK